MRQRTFVIVAIAMFLVAALVRAHNALTFHPLRGYDGFGHFTYIWFMSQTWSVPLPTSGWSFFHPPLYYWGMAALWNGLNDLDPFLRLRIGTLIVSMLSLTHAAVIYVIVRRVAPEQRLIQLLAIGLMLFLPVHIYSTAFLGNEQLGAVLCSLSLLALLWVLARPCLGRCLLLGTLLGLAMLAKFTGIVVLGGAGLTLLLHTWRRGDWRAGILRMAVVGGCVLILSGWYYGRNAWLYGDPFKMSRDEFMVQHVERLQTRGERGLLEYILFDPVILYRPQFPRALPLTGPLPPGTPRSAIRESVWTGMYANTWFDGFGGWALPPVFGSEISRRSGQILLTLATVPTAIIIFGFFLGLRRAWRDGWDDSLVVMLSTFVVMLVVFVHGTRVANMHGAVKATYFMPITVIFSYWFALGLGWIAARSRRLLRYVGVECALLATASVLVFTQGLLMDTHFWQRGLHATAVWNNLEGVVYYAAGDRGTARSRFESVRPYNQHLVYENLATLAYEDGHPLEAAHLLRTAALLQPRQSFGTPMDRAHHDRTTRADYENSLAVLYHQLGWEQDAQRAAERAVDLDPAMPQAHYNQAALLMLGLDDSGPQDGTAEERSLRLRRARRQLFRSVVTDRNFLPAVGLIGVAQAMLGDCAGAVANLERAVHPPRWARQEFPVETGRGISHAASIGRRKHITDLPAHLTPQYWLQRCSPQPDQSAAAATGS